jgi:hypothetical protein
MSIFQTSLVSSLGKLAEWGQVRLSSSLSLGPFFSVRAAYLFATRRRHCARRAAQDTYKAARQAMKGMGQDSKYFSSTKKGASRGEGQTNRARRPAARAPRRVAARNCWRAPHRCLLHRLGFPSRRLSSSLFARRRGV